MGYGLVNEFIDRLHTPLRTTSYYSAIADLHTLQIKFSQTAVSPTAVPWQRLLTVKILQLHVLRLFSQHPVQNSTLN
jgi:hypothetical protein